MLVAVLVFFARLVLVQAHTPLFAQSLENCPDLPPRQGIPNDASDVRPDDIHFVFALGDSITAALMATGPKPGQYLLSKSHLVEDRGISFVTGGESSAPTLFNFFKRYQLDLCGASQGSQQMTACVG
jgi:phospholipase B1